MCKRNLEHKYNTKIALTSGKFKWNIHSQKKEWKQLEVEINKWN